MLRLTLPTQNSMLLAPELSGSRVVEETPAATSLSPWHDFSTSWDRFRAHGAAFTRWSRNLRRGKATIPMIVKSDQQPAQWALSTSVSMVPSVSPGATETINASAAITVAAAMVPDDAKSDKANYGIWV